MQITIINLAAWSVLQYELPAAACRVTHPDKGVRVIPLGRGFGSGNGDGAGGAGYGSGWGHGCSEGGGNGEGCGYGIGVVPGNKLSKTWGLNAVAYNYLETSMVDTSTP